MTEQMPKDKATDLLIRTPPDLAERVRAFASENNYEVEGVVIEALDSFLSGQNKATDRNK